MLVDCVPCGPFVVQKAAEFRKFDSPNFRNVHGNQHHMKKSVPSEFSQWQWWLVEKASLLSDWLIESQIYTYTYSVKKYASVLWSTLDTAELLLNSYSTPSTTGTGRKYSTKLVNKVANPSGQSRWKRLYRFHRQQSCSFIIWPAKAW